MASNYVKELLADVKAKNPAEPEFHQAATEVLDSLDLAIQRRPEYRKHKIVERVLEPERVVMFRVPWLDDQGERAGEPRLPHRDEQRDRPLQGRAAFPSLGQPRHPQVPGVRAGLQELADDAPHGRRQGRIGLRPEGQERHGSHAVLPELHDRVVPAHRAEHRRSGWRHRRRRPRNRLHVRAVQAAAQRVHGRADRQGAELGRFADPPGSDRLRRHVFCRRDAEDAQRDARGQDLPRVGQRQRCAVHGREDQPAGRPRRHACRIPAGTSTTRRASTTRSWRS